MSNRIEKSPGELSPEEQAAGCRIGKVRTHEEIVATLEKELRHANAQRDEAVKEASRIHRTLDMYAKAWLRELGGKVFRKSHEIDALVLTTRWMRERSDRLAVIEAEQKAAALVAEYGPSNEMVRAGRALSASAARTGSGSSAPGQHTEVSR